MKLLDLKIAEPEKKKIFIFKRNYVTLVFLSVSLYCLINRNRIYIEKKKSQYNVNNIV